MQAQSQIVARLYNAPADADLTGYTSVGSVVVSVDPNQPATQRRQLIAAACLSSVQEADWCTLAYTDITGSAVQCAINWTPSPVSVTGYARPDAANLLTLNPVSDPVDAAQINALVAQINTNFAFLVGALQMAPLFYDFIVAQQDPASWQTARPYPFP